MMSNTGQCHFVFNGNTNNIQLYCTYTVNQQFCINKKNILRLRNQL